MKSLLSLLFVSLITVTSFAQVNRELLVVNKVDHLATLAREPMVVQHPNGTLFVAGYRNQSDAPQLWKSSDLGKNWESVDVGNFEDGAQGNSDADLYIDQEGNIFFLSMTYSKVPEDQPDFDMSTLKGEQVVVGVSRDVGKTWKWHQISKNDYDDRPWITASSNGDLHIIWNDGQGVHHSVSNDKGASWTRQPKISDKGGSSFLAHGPNGKLAVRVSPASASGHKMDQGTDYIRLSNDHGKTWQNAGLPEALTWTEDFSGVPRWVEPLAFDDAGNLYSLWSDGNTLKLGVSANDGEDWKIHPLLSHDDTLYFPYMEISGEHIMITWISGFGEKLRHNAGIVKMLNQEPILYSISPQKLDIRSRFAGAGNGLSTGGEYFPMIRMSNGNFGMATTIQNQVSGRLGFTWWELALSTY